MSDSFDWSKHYDIGVYGWWGHDNFGGILTYFALNKVLTKMGYSVLMIQEAIGLPGRYIIRDDCIAMSFALKHYNCSPQIDVDKLCRFNDICDKFVLGGDQVWNYHIPFVKRDSFLNFVDDNRLKISYSSSLGNRDYNPPQYFLDWAKPLMQKMAAVSVREDYAVNLIEEIVGVKAIQVLDAVFLLNKQDYVAAAKDATYEFPKKKFLLAFILNPTVEKRKQVEIIAKKLNLDIICVSDAAEAYYEPFKEIFAGLNILSPLSVSNFIMAYEKASYVVTDSYHGTCMSYVFHKAFSVFFNDLRGADRFESLMNQLQLNSRRIYENESEQDVINNKNIGFNVHWSKADSRIKRERKFSLKWLSDSLKK